MQILSNSLAFVLALGVIVFVHEAGHYMVAKAFGVRVLTFSLGFGRRLFSFRRGDTEYQVSWVPLGGYVAFAGQDPNERTSDPWEFLNRPRWQRVLILLAGPAMNVVLAVVLVAIVFMTGYATTDPKDLPPVIGGVAAGSPADLAGLRTADRVVAIDGVATSSWQDVAFFVLTSPSRSLRVDYERDRVANSTWLKPDTIAGEEVGDAGISALVLIGEVIPDSPAEEAGLLAGDAVLAIDGESIRSFLALRDRVVVREGEALEVEVLRSDSRLRLLVTPRVIDDRVMIGVGQPLKRYTVGEAAIESVRFNADLTGQILVLIKRIFERRISLKASLGGPIQIASVTGAAARRGARDLFLFMAFISINLFVFNLFPIPILDGGQIFILLIEGTLRRDLSFRLKERASQLGLVMIVMLMAMAIYFDLSRSLPSVLSPGPESGAEESPLE